MAQSLHSVFVKKGQSANPLKSPMGNPSCLDVSSALPDVRSSAWASAFRSAWQVLLARHASLGDFNVNRTEA